MSDVFISSEGTTTTNSIASAGGGSGLLATTPTSLGSLNGTVNVSNGTIYGGGYTYTTPSYVLSTNEITVEKVNNGFILFHLGQKYIFTDLTQVTLWLQDNLK
jgi:hypothetical protein